MDPPPVQYVTTSDGYSIAFSAVGKGTPLVITPYVFNNIHSQWTSSLFRHTYECFAANFRLIQYDSRGHGMSTRGLKETSVFDDFVLDLETVVDGLQLEGVVLLGILTHGKVAIRYAVRHPERVRALVLWNVHPTAAHSGAYGSGENLARTNWDFLLEVTARTAFPQDDGDIQRGISGSATTADDFITMNRLVTDENMEQELRLLRVPCLVLTTEASAWSFATEEGSKQAAAAIPGARLSIYNDIGGGLYTPGDEVPAAIEAIRDFVASFDAKVAGSPGLIAPSGLSAREIEVLRLIAAGKSNQAIADELVISLNTVRRHVSNIFDKTGASNRAGAAIYARDHGLA